MAYTDKQKLIDTNVNYTSKDFSTIKADLIEYTKSYFPDTYKDFNETSPGMMLIELSSYVGDVLSYYIDYNYKENLLATATEKRNVRRLSEFLGYKTPNKTPSVARLKVTTTIDADGTTGLPSYGTAPSSIDEGIQIVSNVDSQILFETTSEIDFTSSGSIQVNDDPFTSAPILNSDGEASSYTLTRYVRAVSGQTKTKTFTISSPTKFLELDLGDDNVVEILSCIDSSGLTWYEVDYLAQEKVLKETHYSDDNNRTTAYDQGLGGENDGTNSVIPVPYVAEYIRTNKKFISKFDEDTQTYKVCFGNGLFKFNDNATNVDPVEQAGVTINGDSIADIGAINSTISNNLNLGETPTNTTLTFTYRAGGGATSNVQAGELTTINNAPAGVTISVTNDEPSVGGTDGQTVDEIRNNASAFFATQLRCVTKEDYTARIQSIPAKFGSIAKAYVERLESGLLVSTLSYNENRQLVQTPQLILQNVATYLNQFRMINDVVDFGFILKETLFSGYLINFGVNFIVNGDRRFNLTEVKLNVIQTIKDFFKVEKMQFRQSINMNDLRYNILGLNGVIGIKELSLFQDGNSSYAEGRGLHSFQGDGDSSGGESGYGFKYSFDGSLVDDIYRPSVTPSVFELKNPNQDIYGKVI